jgi:hypothetical protein
MALMVFILLSWVKCFFDLLVIPLFYYFKGCFKSTYLPISLEFWPLEVTRPSFLASKPSSTYTLIGSWCKSHVTNAFNNVFWVVIFRKLCDVGGPLVNTVPFTMLFYGAHSFLYYQHGWHVEGVTIIDSFLSTRHGDPLGGLLFALAHYWVLLKTIAQAPTVSFHP